LDDLSATPPLHRPRPGHADLAGSVKWLTTDCREVLERASARETTVRVAAGALAKCLLREFGIEVFGFVRSVGEAVGKFEVNEGNWRELLTKRDASEVYCPDASADAEMREFINQQKMAKDTAGGVVECHVFGCPVGIGSFLTWDGRLDSRIAAAVVGIQAFKGVEIGMGFGVAELEECGDGFSGDVGEIEIEEDDVGGTGGHLLHGFLGVGGGEGVVATGGEEACEGVACDGFVVDDEDGACV